MQLIRSEFIYRRLTVTELLPIRKAKRIVVLRGRIWLTIDGEPTDYFLDAGESFDLQPTMHVMISGEPRANVKVELAPAATFHNNFGDVYLDLITLRCSRAAQVLGQVWAPCWRWLLGRSTRPGF